MLSIKKNFIHVFLLLILTVSPLAADETDNYLKVTGPCNLEFPKDHGAHPGYRTEWWYYTGNLKSGNGDLYGFQLTFFRSRISPPDSEKKWPREPSAWRTSQVYLAHAAVSDISSGQHLYAEDASRAALGLAGVFQADPITKVFLKNWSTSVEADLHILKVNAAEFSYDLKFKAAKPAIMHGDRGYSLKGSTPERASCYYSFTRLEGQGSITIGGDTVAVTGSAWMDHEYSTAPLEPGLIGWDWFSLQLSDQTEIMIFLLRKEDGGLHPASSGTFIGPTGRARHLASGDFGVAVLDTWKSRHTRASYPTHWRMQIAPLSIDLTLHANLPDQEMRTSGSTGVTYWEGSVSINGVKGDRKIEGLGYVELTGYAGSFDAPL
ncbi:MAG: carotenoid 1,2-hydratase [Desulfobacterales bacterium]|nr:MAG: carotenoid 1,2-hydratase [Desulfobacterales bacterium]